MASLACPIIVNEDLCSLPMHNMSRIHISIQLLLGSLLVAFGMPVVPEEADVQEHAASSRGKAPAPPAKEDVSKVWSDMKSWGKTGPAKMGGADVAMYMQVWAGH